MSDRLLICINLIASGFLTRNTRPQMNILNGLLFLGKRKRELAIDFNRGPIPWQALLAHLSPSSSRIRS